MALTIPSDGLLSLSMSLTMKPTYTNAISCWIQTREKSCLESWTQPKQDVMQYFRGEGVAGSGWQMFMQYKGNINPITLEISDEWHKRDSVN
jgi:hypothetical protein